MGSGFFSRRLQLGAPVFVLSLLLSIAPALRGDDAPKTLLPITPAMDLTTQFKSNNVELSVVPDGSANALSVKIKPNVAFPGFEWTPATGTWDLSAAKGVQMVVTNTGDQPISVSLRAENEPPAGQKNTWSLQGILIGAGETRTLQTVFGKSYGNPSFALDPTKITRIMAYVGGAPSSTERTILIHSIDTFTTVQFQPPADLGKPPGDGLVLWLDPSKDTAVTMDANRAVSQVNDRGDGHHDAKAAAPDALPTLTALDGHHRPMLHFTGKEALKLAAIRTTPGNATVFIVYSRLVGKQTPGPNPTLLASQADATKAADAAPNFVIPGPDAKAPWSLIVPLPLTNVPIGPITIGQDFAGNIGEVLIYDHIFTSEGERRRVLEYLNGKWGIPFPEPGWLRDGPPDPVPVRTHDDLPLSDQKNAGNWTLDPQFTDEFKEKQVDTTRWHLDHTAPNDWWGRKPGLFLPQNVTIDANGLNIKLDLGTPDEVKGHGGYKYTTGYLSTIERTGYGYYEITAKLGKAEFDNAFWFSDTGDPKNGSEIDVFEMGPHTKDYSNKDIMTAHVWGENGDGRHWGSLVAYTLPWNASDDYHVYGMEWTKDHLIWYIDGSPVRNLANTNWSFPQKMIFDVEPMVDWFGPIDDKDFPTAFSVKYVRVWRQPGYVQPAPATPPAPPVAPAPAAPAPAAAP